MQRKSFVLYTDLKEALCELSREQKGELLDAIFAFVEGKNDFDFSSVQAKVAFAFVSSQMRRDADKYEEICARRREYGRMGGLAKQAKGSKSKQKVAKGSKSKQKVAKGSKSKQNVANLADNDNDNDNDNDIQDTKVSMSIVDNNIQPPKGGMSHSDLAANQPKTIREKVVMYFNEKMAHKPIREIRSIENKRKDMLRARMKEYGEQAVYDMIDHAAESSFLNGNNQKGFMATFDWLIRPNNFPKVLEGNYDDNKINEETETNTDWQS